MHPRWSNDEILFQHLTEAVVGDPGEVRELMVADAKAAFTWRTIDVELELLALSYDSSLDEELLVRRAASPGVEPRTLIFEGDTITVCVEIGEEVLTGQLLPAKAGHVTLLTAQGWFGETESDEEGYFLLARPGDGPIRLRCSLDERQLVTDWVSL